MRGEPLVFCRHHPTDETIWHRSTKPCPLCAALVAIARLAEEVKRLEKAAERQKESL